MEKKELELFWSGQLAIEESEEEKEDARAAFKESGSTASGKILIPLMFKYVTYVCRNKIESFDFTSFNEVTINPVILHDINIQAS